MFVSTCCCVNLELYPCLPADSEAWGFDIADKLIFHLMQLQVDTPFSFFSLQLLLQNPKGLGEVYAPRTLPLLLLLCSVLTSVFNLLVHVHVTYVLCCACAHQLKYPIK